VFCEKQGRNFHKTQNPQNNLLLSIENIFFSLEKKAVKARFSCFVEKSGKAGVPTRPGGLTITMPILGYFAHAAGGGGNAA